MTPAPEARVRILRLIRDRGARGATCDEAEEALGLLHQTAAARINELYKPKNRQPPFIRDSGKRRMTRAGVRNKERGSRTASAIVWVAVKR